LVLTDWVMPRMGGEELALRLRGLRPEIRLVFMSGYPLQPARARNEAAPTLYLQKPFASGELVALVGEVLAED
ncbi:MAG: response regulator, partial [Myxococcota bacterium]